MSDSNGAASRRDFLKTAALGAGAAVLATGPARAAGPDRLRVGVIGVGRRGCGAAQNCVTAADNVVITAIGDLFPDQLAAAKTKLATLGEAWQATDDTCFHGWDAYQRVIESGVDLVLLTSPPGFHPLHYAAAIAAGKHVFMEKPGAVDPAGVRSLLKTTAEAERKGLSVVAGTQRRHQHPYREILRRVHDGAIGDIVAAQCYWVGDYGYYPAVLRQAGWSDMEWQLRNWNYFTWLSGDHIVEQHLHNIDVMNWALQAHPVKAIGMGGRQQRTGPEFGHIYDHFAVEFEYPGGVRVQSLCRQMSDTVNRVGEHLVGTRGTADPRRFIKGPNAFEPEDGPDPYVQEHTNLIAAIRGGAPLNEGKALAESTLAAIMGRMACYTGREVSWDWALNESTEDWTPPAYAFGELAVPPVAVPGVTPLL
jgi:predicted dehydrogenase